VIGDTVNLASRLEQANKFYGSHILVSGETRDLAGDDFVFRELDSLQVMGKSEPVRVYELLGWTRRASDEQRQLLERFAAALACYRHQDWGGAEAAWQECLALKPDDQPSRVFIDRVATFRMSPPPANWDGTWTASSK